MERDERGGQLGLREGGVTDWESRFGTPRSGHFGQRMIFIIAGISSVSRPVFRLIPLRVRPRLFTLSIFFAPQLHQSPFLFFRLSGTLPNCQPDSHARRLPPKHLVKLRHHGVQKVDASVGQLERFPNSVAQWLVPPIPQTGKGRRSTCGAPTPLSLRRLLPSASWAPPLGVTDRNEPSTHASLEQRATSW